MPPIFPTQIVRDDSLRWINFFNGRLLTGDDLTQEQTANRDARLRLGQALGDGVVWGLWVSANPGETQVNVSVGEAISRQGQVLCLTQPQTLSLALPPKGQGAANTGWFNTCGQSRPAGDSGASGLYLLTLGPAEGAEGLAPVSGLGNAAAACNSKYRTEAVQFKLIAIPTPAVGDSLLRNATAYDCLGLDSVNACLETPFSLQPEIYGRLDGLRPNPLTDDDVPLAVIFRNANGIQFGDNWSVRRRARLNAQSPNSPWHMFTSDRRTSEGEAAFLQFQEQLADILRFKLAPVTDSTFYAGQCFKVLPPVGLLPTGANGVHWRSFLGLHAPLKETKIDLGLLDQVLLTGMQRQPITLGAAPYIAVDVYRVPDSDFVLFCRSDRGRLQIKFSSESKKGGAAAFTALPQETARRGAVNATFVKDASGGVQPNAPDKNQNQPSGLVIHSAESNLVVNAWSRADGEIISPNLSPGAYRVTGSIGGQAFTRKKVNIVGGQITVIPVPVESLTPENMYLDIGWLAQSREFPIHVRLCLAAGAFADAVEQAYIEAQPWLQEEMNNMENDIQDMEAAQARLNLWQEMLDQRFPALNIGNATPQLFINNQYGFPDPLKVQSLPEVPQVYAVFGKLGVPLTIINTSNEGLTPWNSTDVSFGKDIDLAAALLSYELPYLDQLAGAWVQLIVEATSLTSAESRKLITQAIKKIQTP